MGILVLITLGIGIFLYLCGLFTQDLFPLISGGFIMVWTLLLAIAISL